MSMSEFSGANEFHEHQPPADVLPTLPDITEITIGVEDDPDYEVIEDPYAYEAGEIGIDPELVDEKDEEPETTTESGEEEADVGSLVAQNEVAQPSNDHTERGNDGPPSHDRITVTAINNTKVMAFTGIPLYAEIAEIASETWAVGDHEVQPQLIEPRVNAPGMEVRYRLATALTSNADQVLDIAAGLTPRGLTTATENPDKTYVELDLPVTIDLKTSVMQVLEDRGLATKPDNLHLEAGNALTPEAVQQAARHFDPDKPVAVTSEGLLHYLSHNEKAALAANIRAVLETHGGVWYTDMPVQRPTPQRDSQMASTTSQQTGRSVAANRFADETTARQFFTEQRLEVKRLHSYVEPGLIDSLTSPAAVGLTRQEFIARNQLWSLWEIGLPSDERDRRS